LELWQIIVALIQGLVEWLPISSEGHVVLFIYNFTTIPQNEILSLVVWLHLGTALAVIVRYPRTILDILALKDRVLFRRLLIATLATAITAVPLYFFLKDSLSAIHGEILNIAVGVLLLVTAIFLYLPTRRGESMDVNREDNEPTDKESMITGLAQGFSVLPGLSRSGITVSTLLFQRVEKETALRFSFLMSVPAVLAILLLEVFTGASIPSSVTTLDLVLIEGIVFVVGLASMEFLLRLARNVSFWKLCLVLAAISIVFGIPALL
jgi:undecaprenyl-diphosphatase